MICFRKTIISFIKETIFAFELNPCKMRILLLGSGGREHALAWKLNQSVWTNPLYIAPGNAGTAKCGKNVQLDLKDFDAIRKFCVYEKIEMVIVGPEEPLVNGLYDYFKAHEDVQ